MKSILEEILYVWFYQWPAFHSTATTSPPGHTLHYMVEGEYTLERNGRIETIRKGDLVYYAGNEIHRYIGGSRPVIMYSINFSSPALPEFPRNRRIFRYPEDFTGIFQSLYLSFHQQENPYNTLSAFTALSGILQKMSRWTPISTSREETAWNWKKIETLIKTEQKFRIKPSELSSLLGMSSSTLYRMCIRETGKSPEKNIREIRMSEARKLLQYSGMTISGIASYLGYPRIHEFSREFSNETGHSPSEHKKQISLS